MKRSGIHKPTIEDAVEVSGIESLHPGGMELTRRCANLGKISEGKSVLDVSSGRGTQAILYAQEYGARVTGLDVSSLMVNTATQYVKSANLENQVKFIQGDSQRLPFDSNSFDIVINECAVGIPDDSQQVINEMVRVTKPGGSVIIHETIWKVKLSEMEKADFSERYGTTPLERHEWYEMMKDAGLNEIIYEDEPWSQPEMFWKIRQNRDVKKPSQVFTIKERFITMIRVVRKYGVKGLIKALENERLFYQYVKERKIGYCLYIGIKK